MYLFFDIDKIILKNYQIFSKLRNFLNTIDPIIKNTLNSISKCIKIKSNQIFIFKNQPIFHYYIITKGTLLVYKDNQIFCILGSFYYNLLIL